jgi:hypothetical protein
MVHVGEPHIPGLVVVALASEFDRLITVEEGLALPAGSEVKLRLPRKLGESDSREKANDDQHSGHQVEFVVHLQSPIS